MQPPKCSKCGRPLKDPLSIARGMGPKCAGSSHRSRKLTHKIRRSHGTAYHFDAPSGQITIPVFVERDEETVETATANG